MMGNALMRPRRQVERAELSQQLRDQINFLRASCELFDRGAEREGKRIATVIRILVHDTNYSHSLLQQLGHKAQLQFVARSIQNNPGNRGPFFGLLDIRLGNPPIYQPKLDTEPVRHLPFDGWWLEPVLKDGDETLYTRKQLVLFVANTDGGAHVDPEMDQAYELLSRQNHIGLQVAVGGHQIRWLQNPVLPSLRQIGFEMTETLATLPEYTE